MAAEDGAGDRGSDARHRDFTTACQRDGLDGCTIPDSAGESLPPVQRAELRAFAGTSDQIRAAGAFGAYPLRVSVAEGNQRRMG